VGFLFHRQTLAVQPEGFPVETLISAGLKSLDSLGTKLYYTKFFEKILFLFKLFLMNIINGIHPTIEIVGILPQDR